MTKRAKCPPQVDFHYVRDLMGSYLDDLHYFPFPVLSLLSLFEQYCGGVNGGPGDHAMIEEAVRLKHTNSFKNCYTMFQGDMYATSY